MTVPPDQQAPGPARPTVDPITVEVIGNAMLTIVEEMGETLIRAAYSTSIKERRDCSTALFDIKGRTLAQAEHIPMHLGSLIGIVDHVLKRHPLDDIRAGDAFVGNDAYTGGGTHLNDIVIIEPIFYEGRFIAWATNVAHHADFVDRGHAHIFQEGLRIPPVRLYREGVLQEDVIEMILLNCQVPSDRLNDFRAQMAANRMGIQRFEKVCAKYGMDHTLAACEALLDYAERRTRAGIALIPDGSYQFEDGLDSDTFEGTLELKVAIEVRGDELFFDFAGNPPQVRSSINVVWTALLSLIYYAVKALVDPGIPPNAGLYRPIHVSAPEGSVVNAIAPAAVFSRTQVCQRLADMIFAALAPAIPDRVVSHSTGGALVNFSGINPRTGKFYVYNETVGGGLGARATKDGMDATMAHCMNGANQPIESLESQHPLVVERYELVEDSCGTGKYRGGMAVRRRIRAVDHEARVFMWGACNQTPPLGLFGGRSGGISRLEWSAGVTPPVGPNCIVPAGESVAVVSAGGGGYGDPGTRERTLVQRDLTEERISQSTARDIYGLPTD
jgi:N-methylhydantoinase B